MLQNKDELATLIPEQMKGRFICYEPVTCFFIKSATQEEPTIFLLQPCKNSGKGSIESCKQFIESGIIRSIMTGEETENSLLPPFRSHSFLLCPMFPVEGKTLPVLNNLIVHGIK